ncbi:MAG: BON domain-containing protein, partial [Candidatus Binatia bacterium]
IEQVKGDDVVAVLIDEAQDLSDEMLEELRLLSNLETDKEKLLQIVLMGQPELEWKLDRPELRQLKQRVAMRGRLLPLSRHNVGLYIASRLKTAGYGGNELFASEVVDKVAHYSKGIPRLINVICDNALLIAYATSSQQVSGAMIDEVARDLRLAESAPVVKETPATPATAPKAQSEEGRSRTQREGPILDEVAEFRASPRPKSHRAAWLAIGTAGCFVVLIGIGAVFYSQQRRAALSVLTAKVEDFGGARSNRFAQAKPPATASKRETSAAPNQRQTPATRGTLPSMRDRNPVAAVPETSKPGGAPASQAPEHSADKSPPENAEQDRDKLKPVAKEPPSEGAPHLTSTSEKLETRVYRAISNRAIRGVAVSIVDGTVYLAGQVATERQKAAAAQAARSVPGVKEVRDQITVDFGVGPAAPG